jgi:hypothetical protein
MINHIYVDGAMQLNFTHTHMLQALKEFFKCNDQVEIHETVHGFKAHFTIESGVTVREELDKAKALEKNDLLFLASIPFLRYVTLSKKYLQVAFSVD